MNKDNTLVKMAVDDNFVSFRTYSRGMGTTKRFIFTVDFLRSIMENEGGKYDKDLSNFVSVYRNGDNVSFRFFWLSEFSNGEIHGKTQNVNVPSALICYLLECASLGINATAKHLSKIDNSGAKINFASAGTTLKNVISDKRKRRALSKALRDNFNYSGDSVRLFSDGYNDFYFVCETGWKINGGLILHDYDGKYCYAVHT